jgi:hypothetical protein
VSDGAIALIVIGVLFVALVVVLALALARIAAISDREDRERH